MITQYVSCATDMMFLKGGSRQKRAVILVSVGYVKKTSDEVFLMENFSFNGMRCVCWN